MPRLRAYPIAMEGGLQDSKPIPEVGDLSKLENFALFRGRFALRAPFVETCQLVDEVGTPVDQVMTATFFQGKMYVVAYSDGQNDVYIYRLEPDGTAETGDSEYPNASPIGTAVWTSVTTNVPIPIVTGFQGGALGAQVNRLYIADYDQNYVTRIVTDPAGTPALTDLTADLNADGGSTDKVFFHYVIPYQFHLWGAGIYTNSANDFPTTDKPRPELLRFSQPGMVAKTDPDYGSGTSEWWKNDWRGIGSRGDKITCMAVAGPSLIVFKRRETYQIQGYDAASWGLHVLSVRVGAVGPYAACSTDDGFCYFWSEKGPHVITSEGQVIDIGEDIRKRVAEAGIDEFTAAEYSADDGIVYFSRNVDAAAAPNWYLAFDHRRQKWTEGQWLGNSGSAVLINNLVAIPSEALAGPAGPPSAFSVTRVSDDEMDLAWTNGDTSLGAVTEIYRNTSDMADPPPAGNIHATVGAGVDSYTDDGTGDEGVLSENTRYYYAIRHVKNGTASATVEDDDYTKLTAPNSVVAQNYATGITVAGNRGSSVTNVDVTIQRRLLPSGLFADVHTITSATATWQWNDTTVSCGSEYEYQARCEESSGGDPPYDSDYSNTADNEACKSPPVLGKVTVSDPTLTGSCPMSENASVSYTASNIDPGDKVVIYRKLNRDTWDYVGEFAAQTNDTINVYYPYITGGDTGYFQGRVELWEDGVTLVETKDSAEKVTSYDSGGPCPE